MKIIDTFANEPRPCPKAMARQTPRQISSTLAALYHREMGQPWPLDLAVRGEANRLVVMAWKAWLEATFEGFHSDGCTMAPDGNALVVCIWHDVLYWIGVDQRLADMELLYWMRVMRIQVKGWRGVVRWIANHAWARLYYKAVRTVGWIPYRSHRRREVKS